MSALCVVIKHLARLIGQSDETLVSVPVRTESNLIFLHGVTEVIRQANYVALGY